ncbi:PIR protein [Plasmodium vivax]|uniref:VIR protein n=1 Tax=Plasmodium vivax TaxID=5855 RepID=A0A565A3Q0_PLAVI|nr:PIR protein [Plasmodium vivax]
MKNYPFLEDIWKKYNFDEAVNYSDESRIFSLCNNDVTYIGEHASEQKNICRKLLRNLKLLHSGTYMADDFVKCCNNINNWLYYKTKEDNISDDTINSIFAASNKIIEKKGYLDCSYFTFNKGFLEPEKLVMLRVFNNNADNIREILSNEFHSKICSCQKFIKQCVDLYKDMHEDHCSKGYTTNSSQEGTCEIVKSFRTLYEGYLTKDKIKYKIPELSSNTPTDIIDGCSSEETDSGPAPPEQSKQSGNSITQNTSHALASMVGIPPFLALIYKFTPIRKVFLSKNKKDTRAFNNLDQEIENEFFHHKYGDTNASQLKFNVSYSPV